jgi:hypothetical protein
VSSSPPTLCDRCACWTRNPVAFECEASYRTDPPTVREAVSEEYGYVTLCPRCHGIVTKALEALKPRRRKNARGA